MLFRTHTILRRHGGWWSHHGFPVEPRGQRRGTRVGACASSQLFQFLRVKVQRFSQGSGSSGDTHYSSWIPSRVVSNGGDRCRCQVHGSRIEGQCSRGKAKWSNGRRGRSEVTVQKNVMMVRMMQNRAHFWKRRGRGRRWREGRQQRWRAQWRDHISTTGQLMLALLLPQLLLLLLLMEVMMVMLVKQSGQCDRQARRRRVKKRGHRSRRWVVTIVSGETRVTRTVNNVISGGCRRCYSWSNTSGRSGRSRRETIDKKETSSKFVFCDRKKAQALVTTATSSSPSSCLFCFWRELFFKKGSLGLFMEAISFELRLRLIWWLPVAGVSRRNAGYSRSRLDSNRIARIGRECGDSSRRGGRID